MINSSIIYCICSCSLESIAYLPPSGPGIPIESVSRNFESAEGALCCGSQPRVTSPQVRTLPTPRASSWSRACVSSFWRTLVSAAGVRSIFGLPPLHRTVSPDPSAAPVASWAGRPRVFSGVWVMVTEIGQGRPGSDRERRPFAGRRSPRTAAFNGGGQQMETREGEAGAR